MTPLRTLGVCTHFERRSGGWKAESLVPLIAGMGAALVRQEIDWSQVEREAGVYAIPTVDRDWLDRVRAAGLRIILVLCYGNPVHADPLDPQAYARYAAYMAAELRDYPIAAFELWNEPTNFAILKTHGGAWSGRAPSPWVDRYAEMIAAAAPAIKAADPRARVIINPGECQFAHMVRSHAAALAQVDGVAHHPYPTRFPPETVPWGGPQIRARDGIDAADDDHSFASLWRMTREHSRTGLGRELTVYATEYGYSTYNHHRKPASFAGYSPAVQAAYLVRGVVLGCACGLEALAIYDFMDDGTDRYEAEHNFGLVAHESAGWRPKPAWAALRRLAAGLGAGWRISAEPGVILDCPQVPLPRNQDEWQAPVVEPHLRICSPQLVAFDLDDGGHAAVLWGGGRHPGEWNPPLGDLVFAHPPQGAVEVLDLVSGTEPPAVLRDGRLRDLPVGGEPLLVRWRS